jgi:hypothetical protein
MKEINLKINELVELLKMHLPDTTTSVNIFINCEGVEMETKKRSYYSLVKSGISMRNISGEFIRQNMTD